ncbi:GAF domain-containing protein [Streptomyces sp. NPDC004609]|uniref:GAF domain-containing protein n=1 Tax=Streptomyces sp. NPDC004609 TaxID=3364704 RepID=UPI0036BB88A9
MTVPPSLHDIHSTPAAAALPGRADLLRILGLTGPDDELDALAARLAADADVPYAMVNAFGDEQHFVGLHAIQGPGLPDVGRSMALDHGWCPEVVRRRLPLVLPDVFASPRFAGNPVVDAIGIRTYAGAPVIFNGTVLGTVCFVGPQPRHLSTGNAALDLIKTHRDELLGLLHHRARHPAT